jgi:glycine/D-amino acid oxidase-like deaminating enzyme
MRQSFSLAFVFIATPRTGLTIAAGDCGHGFKFAPVLGGIIADAVEGKVNPKFRWRPEVKPGVAKEAARFQGDL